MRNKPMEGVCNMTNYVKIEITENEVTGQKVYMKNGELHHDDGPAIELPDGTKKWYLEGKEYTKEEYDQLSIKKDVFKITYKKDGVYYSKNGLLHRADGPAMVLNYGYKAWYIDGKRHREDGPACEWDDGTKAWFIEGKQYSKEEFNQYILSKKNTEESIVEELVVHVKKNQKVRFVYVD